MRPQTTTQRVNPSPSIAPPARLIPGARSEVIGGTRKKAASVRVDGRFWEWREPENVVVATKTSFLRAAARSVLPSPSVYGPHWNLVRQVIADFLFILGTFIAVDRMTAPLQFVLRGEPVTLLRGGRFA